MTLQPKRTRWPRLPIAMEAIAIVLFVALALLRAWRLEEYIGVYSGCRGCFWLSSLGHDAWLLAVILGLISLGCLAPWRSLRMLARIGAAVLLLLFAGDIATTGLLSQRLYLADILRFGKHAGDDFSVVRAALASPAGLAAGAVGLLVVLASASLVAVTRRRPRAGLTNLAAALLCGVFSMYAASRPVRYVHDLFLDNVVEANLPQGRVATFSPQFIEAQHAAAQIPAQTCTSRAATTGRSAIVLMVESLSAWHSHLLGSSYDWTPKLDAIARSNHFFTNFYANGFTTSMGEIAVLAGKKPLITPGKPMFEFGDYATAEGGLSDIAQRSGREAAFFTTGDVSFLDLGDWLHRIGFDVVDGSKDAFYNGRKRWQFGAADDASLYERFLKWLDERDNTRPFVSALLTVSSHPPFVDPRTAKIDPEATFRYVDEQIAHFHDELEKRGFFKHGILLVLGDHRSMTPLHAEEFRTYGERAFARIPMIVAGDVEMPSIVDTAFQQTDIAPSIAQWLGLPQCAGPFTGLFLQPDPQPAQYVLHSRGDNRNRVDVYHGADTSSFLLDGDGSSWMGTPPPHAHFIAAWIDWQREQARDRGLATRDHAALNAPAPATAPANK